MASPLLERLEQELEDIASEYDVRFSGKPRRDRNTEELGGLIRRLQIVLDQIEEFPPATRGNELTRIRDAATRNLSIYNTEQSAIAEANAAGDDFDAFGPLAAAANFIFARYRRHYGGQARATRDLEALQELTEELASIAEQMAAFVTTKPIGSFTRDYQLVSQTLQMYRNEWAEIDSAQRAGTPSEQANHLAAVANEQFRLYRVHFANKARISRRPALLIRIVSTLERVLGRMRGLRDEGLTNTFNDQNIAVVEANLAIYKPELDEVRKARKSASLRELLGALGGAANEIFERYNSQFANRDRSAMDLVELGNLCDGLAEIARQMSDLSLAAEDPTTLRNQDIVLESLAGFEREYELIREARQ